MAVMPAPSVEMLWESVDPQEALTRRFGFADAGRVADWVTTVFARTWGVQVISCDRVVISAGNALVWITSSNGRMILKWSVVPALFPRLADVARLTSWLGRRGLPVSAPVPALSGHLQVEVGGLSVGLQSVVEGSLLEVDDLAQVHAAGAVLARLHLAMAEYPGAGRLGPGGQGESAPLRTRVDSWLETGAGDHVAPRGASLRRRLGSLPPDSALPPAQLVHLDFRSANVLCEADQIVAVLDFEEAGVDYSVNDLAKSAVLLGTRFRHWGPVSSEAHDALVAGYQAVRELSCAEAAWLQPLLLWRTLQQVPKGGDPTGWAESAEGM